MGELERRAAISEYAAARPRCTCGSFLHPGKPCPKRGGSKVRTTPEDRLATRRATAKRWTEANKEKVAAQRKRDREALRLAVLTHYSHMDVPACACCNESMMDFLILDHISGGGNQARLARGNRGGTAYYRALRREGYPEGYRVLCWNCNAAFGLYGRCPHGDWTRCRGSDDPVVHLPAPA